MRRDSWRVCVVLIILCHFVLIAGWIQGGIISLNSYVITVEGQHKTLILVGLVHTGDFESDTFVLSNPRCDKDIPAHAKIIEKVLRDRLCEDDESGKRSVIPVVLEKGKFTQVPNLSMFEDQLILNRNLLTKRLFRIPLICADPRTQEDLIFRRWLIGDLPPNINILQDPKEISIKKEEYERYLSRYDLNIYPLKGGGVELFNFAPYLHVKDNIGRYEKIASAFELHVKQLGRGDLLIPELHDKHTAVDSFPSSAIQTHIVVINNVFLVWLNKWLIHRDFAQFCKKIGVDGEQQAVKKVLANNLNEYLVNMSFFSQCAEQLSQPAVQTVVACLGNAHALGIGKMIQEVGGRVMPTSLGMLDNTGKIGPRLNPLRMVDDIRERSPFLTPFQLRMFLSISLGLPVDKGDAIIFEEMNSGKLIDAPRCNWCRKKQSEGLLLCNGCQKVFYCGAECQNADYSYHLAKCASHW